VRLVAGTVDNGIARLGTMLGVRKTRNVLMCIFQSSNPDRNIWKHFVIEETETETDALHAYRLTAQLASRLYWRRGDQQSAVRVSASKCV